MNMSLGGVVDKVLGHLFEVMSPDGHAGHCILVSRTLDHVFGRLGIESYPMCVDYEVLNPAALAHVNSGGDLHILTGAAFAGRTGTGRSGMYDHHVVTAIPDEPRCLIVDPAITEVWRAIPGLHLPTIMLDMSFPLPPSHSLEVHGCRLTYHFRPELTDFQKNYQWTSETAARYARTILQRLSDEDRDGLQRAPWQAPGSS